MHLFEFMDQDWVPKSLRDTLRDILECGNGAPFRPYYAWVAQSAAKIAKDRELHCIAELGCGTAPITRHLAKLKDLPSNLRIVACDLNPDLGALEEAKSLDPSRIEYLTEPVDFSIAREWPEKTLVLLSATFHHIPAEYRPQVLQSLSESANSVAIYEPLRNTMASLLFVLGSTVPAMLTPLRFFGRPGTMRRILWCWLIPIAPLMFVWDGWVSCLREWEQKDWRSALKDLHIDAQKIDYQQSLFCSAITFSSQEMEKASV